MGRVKPGTERAWANARNESIKTITKAFFEPQLKSLDLGEEQIRQQNLSQLLQNLETVNEAIQNPDSFGVCGLSITAEAGTGIAYITKGPQNATFQVGILPILLERKRLILERISILKGEEKIEGLQALIQKVPDDQIRQKLEEEIVELKETSKQLREQINEVKEIQEKKGQEELEELSELEIMVQKTELLERRSQVWLNFLERESVATIVGSILLVIIVISILVAMFLDIQTTEIVNNGFLVLLGYFFGQTISRAARADTQN
jgi:hypothetical protein